MSEIINLQVGQCGNQIGSEFWDLITNEHGIDQKGLQKGHAKNQIERTGVYFNEIGENRFVPRAIHVDLDPASNESILASPQAKLFNPANFISGLGSSGNNWAIAHYTNGKEIVDRALEAIRQEAERSDQLQGFQMTHSLGGGTGSGLGMLLIDKLRNQFPKKIVMTFSVFPSPIVNENILEPYNTMLSMKHLVENVDNCIVIDNKALQDICSRQLRPDCQNYQDVNHIIAQTMSGVTSSLRYRGQLHSDLENLTSNLVPFPRLHFHMVSQSPIITKEQTIQISLNIVELTQEIYSPQSILCSADPTHGRYLAGAVLFRGKVPTVEVDKQMNNVQNKNSSFYIEWLPNDLKYSICSVAPKGLKSSATFIGNSSAVVAVFSKILYKYQRLYNRKAFRYIYEDEGVDQMEFQEPITLIEDLKAEYLEYQNLSVDNKKNMQGIDVDPEN